MPTCNFPEGLLPVSRSPLPVDVLTVHSVGIRSPSKLEAKSSRRASRKCSVYPKSVSEWALHDGDMRKNLGRAIACTDLGMNPNKDIWGWNVCLHTGVHTGIKQISLVYLWLGLFFVSSKQMTWITAQRLESSQGWKASALSAELNNLGTWAFSIPWAVETDPSPAKPPGPEVSAGSVLGAQ